MKVYFVTNNRNKLQEVIEIIDNKDIIIENISVDLPELQELDSIKIIQEKLNYAKDLPELKHKKFFVEDTSLCFDELNDFPGPLIKWFYKVLGPNKIFDIVKNNPKAKAKVIIGYFDGINSHFFEGVILGNIVSPRGSNGFNWDVIFQPLGYSKTFAEMDNNEKNLVSMRKLATLEFKKFLEKNLK